MQNQPVARGKPGNGLGNLRFGQATVGAAVEQDTVLAAPVHLNDCVALQRFGFLQVCGIDTIVFKGLPEHPTALAHAARVTDCRTGLCQRHRLVQSLAAGVDRLVQCVQRFSGPHKVIHLIYIIQVQRTEIQGFHFMPSLLIL